ncbi:MAG: hypothetical protein KatS3mg109_0284 [Pirellulaceae bacterium]|nr:MAG: hypothetical protein KatS3mg109_0284 [Pirellulaceae bacterium]
MEPGAHHRQCQQRVVQHPAEYRLTEADRRQVASGQGVFVTGRALAMADVVCRSAGSSEVMWYWLARQQEPMVIDSLVVPERQWAGQGYCATPPDEILRLNRRVRRQGRVIVGAGHSHGNMPVFSSAVDRSQMKQLAEEKVGFPGQSVWRLALACLAEEAGEAGNPGSHDGSSANFPLVAIFQSQVVSVFSTHNNEGDFWFPTFRQSLCPLCCTVLEEYLDGTCLHVLGERSIDDQTAGFLVRCVWRSLMGDYWRTTTYGNSLPRGDRCSEAHGEQFEDTFSDSSHCRSMATGSALAPSQSGPTTPVQPVETTDSRRRDSEFTEAPEFEVWRDGRLVGRIPAALLEEAAQRVPPLAVALAWQNPSACRDQSGGSGPGDGAIPPNFDQAERVDGKHN